MWVSYHDWDWIGLSFSPSQKGGRRDVTDREDGQVDSPHLLVVEDLDSVNGHLLPEFDIGYVWFPPPCE